MFTYIITIKIAKALTQISAFSTYAFVVFTTFIYNDIQIFSDKGIII